MCRSEGEKRTDSVFSTSSYTMSINYLTPSCDSRRREKVGDRAVYRIFAKGGELGVCQKEGGQGCS